MTKELELEVGGADQVVLDELSLSGCMALKWTGRLLCMV